METKLRQFLRERNMTQGDLMRALDVSRTTVSLFTNGHRSPSGSFRWKFASKYGFDAASAVFDTDQEKKSK